MYAHPNNLGSMAEIFGEPIHTYTRKQAIEDGVLVEFTDPESDTAEVCAQHYPGRSIACTAAVFETMRRAVENKRFCNDYAGVLHDMLWMSRVHKTRIIDPYTCEFTVIITGAGRKRLYTFKIVGGPGDHGEPVATIMLPEED